MLAKWETIFSQNHAKSNADDTTAFNGGPMLRIEKRKSSGIWRVRGTHHGRSVDQSARTRSKTEAEYVREAIERKIFEEVHGIKQRQSYTFAEAVNRWLDTGKDAGSFPYFDKMLIELGRDELEGLTQDRIDSAALKVMPGVKPATRKRHFYTPVSVILQFAAKNKMMTPMLLERPKVAQKRPDILSPEDVDRLINAAGDFAPLLTFFIGTGGRTSEVMRLKWQDVSPNANKVTFWKTKAGELTESLKPRSVYLCDRTRSAMPKRSDGRVWGDWAEIKGRFHGPATRLARLSKSVLGREVRPHILRHTWATWRYSLKPDTLDLMRAGGWSDQKMVEVYVHLSSPDLAEKVRGLGWFSGTELGNIRAINGAR